MEQDEDATNGGYDFEARMYNSQVGRWWSVDPLASKNTHASPYEGFGSNPILYVDPDGRDNILYIAFIDKGGELELTQATKDKIVARAQEIYSNNGITNVKVVGITVENAFSRAELGFLDETDRIAYLGRSEVINTEEFADGTAQPGKTIRVENYDGTRLTEVGYLNLDKPFGFRPIAQMQLDGLIGDNVSPETKRLSEKYKPDVKALYPNAKYFVMDPISSIARGLIHEAGGHGVLAVFGDRGWHPNDSGGKLDERYGETTHADNIMKGGNLSIRDYGFMQERAPDQLKFLEVDLKLIKKFYENKTPKDNFTRRLKSRRAVSPEVNGRRSGGGGGTPSYDCQGC